MLIRRAAFIVCLIIPGISVAAFCGYYALVDWAQLQVDYKHYQVVAGSSAGFRNLFAAYAAQDIHRINLFADGVWTLLGALLAGMGILGLCLLRNVNKA